MPKGGKGRGRGRGGGTSGDQQNVNPPGVQPSEVPRGRGRGRSDAVPQPAEAAPPPPRAEPAPPPPRAEPAPPPPRAEPAAASASSMAQKVSEVTRKVERLGSELVFMEGMPKKQPPGTLGRRIELVANHFPVSIPDGYLYHYDVDIEPVRGQAVATGAKPKRQPPTGRRVNSRICRLVMDKLFNTTEVFGKQLPAYDGHKNIITRNPLAIKKLEVFLVELVEEGDRKSKFKVSIQPVVKEETGSCAISLDPLHAIMQGKCQMDFPQEAIMALDIVLRTGPSMVLTPLQRSFFFTPRNPNEAPDLGGGKEVWFGYYQSLRPGQWKPMLNINKSATTFFTAQSVIDFVLTFLGKSPASLVTLDMKEISSLTKELKGVQIEVTHLPYPRKYRVLRVTQQKASQIEFTITGSNGQQIKTVVDKYFRDTYKKTLRYPNLPCIQTQPEEKKIFLPLEVCRIVAHQPNKRKLTNVQTAKMIRFTATPPAERFQDIKKALQNTLDASRPHLKEFDIKVSTEPLQLNGRVIEPPHVLYKDNKTASPMNGAWDLKDCKFFQGARIEAWVVLNFSSYCRENNVQTFVGMLCKFGQEVGMYMANPLAKLEYGRDRRPVSAIMRELKARHPNLKLAVVILGRNTEYADIKHIAETKEGIQTQCIKDENVIKKCNPQLIVNLLQKINAKVEGVNCSLVPREKPSIFRRPVIIFGADVTHPAPGERGKPSVAAVVASMDSYPCRYAVSVRVQQNRDKLENKPLEIIVKLDEMVRELLLAFYKKTSYKPEKIIFYRDGVSEGQFAEVQQQEIEKLRKACSSLQADYQPLITFIVVQKRHHTRFMPKNTRDGVGKCKNIPPGTTIDTDVVSSVNFDFFLCSHTGIQGTSRPAHYTALWDDNGFTADELHKLTYHLCHTYVRCTRSISIPAPVMYAHLAAYRARNHIKSGADASSSSSESSDGSAEYILSEDILRSVIVVDSLKEQMYFV